MTKLELELLQKLLLKFNDTNKELTILTTTIKDDKLYSLLHENEDDFCTLDIKIDLLLN